MCWNVANKRPIRQLGRVLSVIRASFYRNMITETITSRVKAALKGELLDVLLKTFWFYSFGELSRAEESKSFDCDSCWASHLSDYFKNAESAGILFCLDMEKQNKTKKSVTHKWCNCIGPDVGRCCHGCFTSPTSRWLQAENCDRRLQGTKPLMRADRASLQRTAVSADCCHFLWHSVEPANQRCLWKITNTSKEPYFAPVILLWFWTTLITLCYAFILLLAATIGK